MPGTDWWIEETLPGVHKWNRGRKSDSTNLTMPSSQSKCWATRWLHSELERHSVE